MSELEATWEPKPACWTDSVSVPCESCSLSIFLVQGLVGGPARVRKRKSGSQGGHRGYGLRTI